MKMRTVAKCLLILNLCMYTVVLVLCGWAGERAIDHGFVIGKTYLKLNLHHRISHFDSTSKGLETGKGLDLPQHFSPIYFPMGNPATGFFVFFSLIAGAVGVASAINGLSHLQYWDIKSLPAAAAASTIAWTLTLVALGFAWKEIHLSGRNSRLITMEALIIILSATQLFYIAAVHAGASIDVAETK